MIPMISAGALSGIASAAGGSSLMAGLGSIGSSIGSFLNSNLGAGLTMGLGSLAGGLLSNQANAEQAHRNRVLIRQMAKNRYQWTVEDLRKAGINPIYAVQGGSAPSATGGAIAQNHDVVTPAIGTAMSVMSGLSKIQNERMLALSQANLNQSQAANTAARTADQLERNIHARPRYEAEINRIYAQEEEARASARSKVLENDRDRLRREQLQLQIKKDQLQVKALENSAESLLNPTWNRGVGYTEDVLDLLGRAIFSAAGFGGAVKALKGFFPVAR